MKMRLRTKLLFSLLLVSVGLTSASLLIARRVMEKQVRKEISQDLHNSLSTFQNVERQRELGLNRTAQLMADMPNLRALMTSEDEPTIQDGSHDFFKLAGADLLVLSDPGSRIMALHASPPGITREQVQQALQRSQNQDRPNHWWYGNNHLYEVSIQPIYFGAPVDNRLLGFLAIGDEIDDALLQEISQIAASQVAFRYGSEVARSTLSAPQEAELLRQPVQPAGAMGLDEVELGEERFLVASVDVANDSGHSVRLSVLKSLDQATAFLSQLDSNLLGVGLLAVLLGAGLVYLISYTFTRPLGDLVAGVRALAKGDFSYPLATGGSDEVAEVRAAFDRMRSSLYETQRRLLDAERLATIGRMASSISHDLRHSLAAIMANAEFLSANNRSFAEREELYGEVRVGVNQMTDLLDSLLEFSRSRESLRLSHASLEDILKRTIQAVRAHPEFHDIDIQLCCGGNSEGCFEPKKLERAFQNLVRNACEALPAQGGKVEVKLRETEAGLEVRITDNGHGIPEAIREQIFEPFVSEGKKNGTGLGLTIVQKIVQDHGGDVQVEHTSKQGSTFVVFLPRMMESQTASREAGVGVQHPLE
ncbi:MAG TPA: HAMP domain-containing sensor histidine kinase [Terriglobales bacterium]|nr:HAMP domain-containing sensor histidine kinase [Terriglobales bacterium]